MSDRILLVEDDAQQRKLVAELLRGAGREVAEAASAEEALALLDGSRFDLVLSDWKLPQMDGEALSREVRRRSSSVAFVLITAYGTISRAVAAVRGGADDYLTKPFERDELLLAVERAIGARRLADENRRLSEALVEARGERDRLVGLIGRSPAMQKVFRHVSRVADSTAAVLVSGESGTGKALVARALHALSPRAGGPFVALDCRALPPGAGAGAPFDAADPRSAAGSARGGTLFLDEVGDLPSALQPALLRSLEERALDARIIAATSRDLQGDVAQGTFRDDLYYQLAVVPVHMPPLRERREDVPLLLEHFLEAACKRHGRARPRLNGALTRRLLDHPWPGNVRELASLVERMLLSAGDRPLDVSDLPADFGPTLPAGGGRFRLDPNGLDWEAHERDALVQALELARGNRARAAKLLGLGYKAFLYRLEKHGLRPAAGAPE